MLLRFPFLIAVLTLILGGNILAADPGVGAWEAFGNGPSHTGYYPATIGTNAFKASWSKEFSIGINPVVVSGTKVFYTTAGYSEGTEVRQAGALDANTGAPIWTCPLGNALAVTGPTFANGRIYFQRRDEFTFDSRVWCLDASIGAFVWASSYGSQNVRYMAPTVADGGLWAPGGGYGGLYGFDANTGGERFFVRHQQFIEWAPAYSNGIVYTWLNGDFRAMDGETGTWIWSRDFGSEHSVLPINGTVAVSGQKAFVIGNSGLRAIDLAAREGAWVVSGTFDGTPAVDQSRVYALSGNVVKSYDIATGTAAGEYKGKSPLISQPLITNDRVIAASRTATYVFNRTTRALLQTLPAGGLLSYANGRLYVATASDDNSNSGKISTFSVALKQPEPTPSPAPSPTPQATPSPTPGATPMPTPTPFPLPTPPVENAGTPWIDAQESDGIAYFLFKTPARLERYDLGQKLWLSPLALTGVPEAFAVDEEGIYVSGAGVSRYGLDGSGPALLPDGDHDVRQLYSDGDILYLVSPWRIWSVNKNSGQTVGTAESLSGPFLGLAVARERNLVFYRSGGSPIDIVKLGSDEEGTLKSRYNNVNNSEEARGQKATVSPDEKLIFDDTGIAYDITSMQYGGSLAGPYTDIAFEQDKPVVIRGNTLSAYSAELLETGRLVLPVGARKVFVYDGSAVVFYAASPRGAWAFDLPLENIVPPEPSAPANPAGLAFSPDAIEYGNGVVYLLSRSNLAVFRWSLSEKAYLDSIPLYEAPSRIAYSPVERRLYLAYPSGRISYFADGEPGSEDNFVNIPNAPRGILAMDNLLFASSDDDSASEFFAFGDRKKAGVRVPQIRSTDFCWNSALRKLYYMGDSALVSEKVDGHGGFGETRQSLRNFSEGFAAPIRVSPDGAKVVLGSGHVFNADSMALEAKMPSTLIDGVWFGSRFVSMKASGADTTLVEWNGSYSATTDSRTIAGTSLRLFRWDNGFLAVTQVGGVPSFTVMGNTLNGPEPTDLQIKKRVITLSGDLSFGEVGVNESAEKTLTISNSGNAPLAIEGISHDLSVFSGDFSGIIAAGGSQDVTITFAPTLVTEFPGQLAVVSDATSGTFTKAETGRGVPEPPPPPPPVTEGETRIVSLGGDLDFGKVVPGTPLTRTLTLTNTGNTALVISGIAHSNAAFQGTFSGTISPGDSQAIDITFTASAYKTYSGKLKVLSDATGGISSLAERGSGSHNPDEAALTRIISVGGNLDFGSVPLKKTAKRTLVITNLGTGPLTIQGLTHPFGAFTGNFKGTLRAGASRSVTVTFRPKAAGFYAGKIGISSNATNGPSFVTESGTGQTP